MESELSLSIIDQPASAKKINAVFSRYFSFFYYNANNFDDGLKVLETLKIDVIVINLCMKGSVDFYLLRQIKAIQPDLISLVSLSGKSNLISKIAQIHGIYGTLQMCNLDSDVFQLTQLILKMEHLYLSNRTEYDQKVKGIGLLKKLALKENIGCA